MKLQVPPELEAKLNRLAAETGRTVDQVALDLLVSSVTPTIIEKRLTRDELVAEFVCRLKEANRSGMRVCFGQDHQYSIPYALAQELSLSNRSWREALHALCAGTYGADGPRRFAESM